MSASDADLDYLRDVAASGLRAPLLGGRFFIWWGGLAALALTAHWTILAGLTPFGQPALGFLWMSYGLIGLTGSALLGRSVRRKPGRGATPVRAERAVWGAMVLSVTAWALGCVAAALSGRAPMMIFDTIPLVAFLGYGVSFSVTAALGGPSWMRLTGWASFIAAGLGLSLIGRPEFYLLCAACVGVLAIIPGILLLRAEPPSEEPAP